MIHEKNFEQIFNIKHPNNIYPKLGEIGEFLEDVVLNFWVSAFDINELDYLSEEDQYKWCCDYMHKKYSNIINNVPLEVIYYYGIIDILFNNSLFSEKLYGLNRIELQNIYNRTNDQYFSGKFTDKAEDILINKLGINKLIN